MTVRVGLNLLWLVPGVVGGSEEYTTGLLRAVAAQNPRDLHLTLFVLPGFTRAHPDLATTFSTVVADIDGSSKARRVLVESTWLGREASRRNIDLLHHAGGVVPPGVGTVGQPVVMTIHDLQPLAMPENFSLVKRRWLARMLPYSARRSRLVITPSDTTATSVVERLGVPMARVRTVPHGLQSIGRPSEKALDDVRGRYRLDGRVILYPAITYPHKDHITLIRGFANLARGRPGLILLLTGGAGPAEQAVVEAIRTSGVAGQIRRTDRVPRDHIEALYGVADLVAVPSRFEGFGLPVLEAMAAGVPVVASASTSLPWVTAGAAELVSTRDPAAWADALGRVLDDPGHADRLRVSGTSRARQFTWQSSGAALMAAYRDAAAMRDT